MRQYFLLIVILTLYVSGCLATTPPAPIIWTSTFSSDPKTSYVFLDNRLSALFQQQAIQAISEWNAILKGRLILQVVLGLPASEKNLYQIKNKDNICIIGVHSSHAMIQRRYFLHTIATAYPWGEKSPGSLIYLATDKIHNPHQTVLHEIGHALGAVDREQDGMLMSQKYSGIDYIDDDAIRQVAQSLNLR